MIDELRVEDLLNNAERDMLRFRFIKLRQHALDEENNSGNEVTGNSALSHDYYLPLFLTAGAIDKVFQFFNQRSAIYRAIKGDQIILCVVHHQIIPSQSVLNY